MSPKASRPEYFVVYDVLNPRVLPLQHESGHLQSRLSPLISDGERPLDARARHAGLRWQQAEVLESIAMSAFIDR